MCGCDSAYERSGEHAEQTVALWPEFSFLVDSHFDCEYSTVAGPVLYAVVT